MQVIPHKDNIKCKYKHLVIKIQSSEKKLEILGTETFCKTILVILLKTDVAIKLIKIPKYITMGVD